MVRDILHFVDTLDEWLWRKKSDSFLVTVVVLCLQRWSLNQYQCPPYDCCIYNKLFK